jgi:enamine deaminase RidA (YjgF/YER057c/UK114 family)
MTPINPSRWGAPKGYSNGILCGPGRLLFVAGQIGWGPDQTLVGDDFVAQFRQALANVRTVVEAAGGAPNHVGRLTIYVTDKAEYTADLSAVGAAYREVMGRHFPAMALVEVKGLLEPGAKVEIEATAVVPEETSP